MIRPDLHMHTTASDGIYTASQLARLVQRADVTLFSITDHDTLAGLPSAADAAYDRGLAFIPGVEISSEEGSGTTVYVIIPCNASVIKRKKTA